MTTTSTIKRDGRVESRRKAQKVADTFEDIARNLLTAVQAQAVIQELFQKARQESLPSTSIKDRAQDWPADKEGAISPSSPVKNANRPVSFPSEHV
ncbi:hypothetical protein [Haloferula sargassicola]|uniref:Transposase n=1 Tax=Haloferula sargassicola TaxID=490096 RepID=A0ABP9URN0_9BACT